MAGQFPVNRGHNPLTRPELFGHADDTTFFQSKTTPEVLVFNNTDNSSGSTVYSEPISVAPAEGFSVYVTGTGNVEVQVTVNPASDIWVTLGTINNGGSYSTNDKHPWVRLGQVTASSGITAYVYRQYSSY